MRSLEAVIGNSGKKGGLENRIHDKNVYEGKEGRRQKTGRACADKSSLIPL